MHDGDTYYDIHHPHFSQPELAEALGETTANINHWVFSGYLKPTAYLNDPRGGKPRRRFSIMALVRGKIIAACADDIGLRPIHATGVADFAIPFLNERLDRRANGKLITKSRIFIVSRIEGEKIRSVPIYQRPNETAIYADDPERNPDAKVVWIDFPAFVIPISTIFTDVFLKATELLAKQERGGMDEFRRPLVRAEPEPS
jgi:hypothetical protein